MAGRLHPFRHHPDAERAADIDDRADEIAACPRFGHLLHQFPVDLQGARAQPQQADDRGVAGAEIIDFDVDAKLLQLLEIGGNRLVAIVERDRFQQFEGDRAGLDLQGAQLLAELRIG
ncbi:hypothetical protein D3C87_1800320 [compost metagenome]